MHKDGEETSDGNADEIEKVKCLGPCSGACYPGENEDFFIVVKKV